MFPAVAIDFGADAPTPIVEQVLRACSAAIEAGQCQRSQSVQDAPLRAVAIVRRSGELGVRIEVGRRAEPQTKWAVRELEFGPQDPELERWRSVGLAVATLVGEVAPLREPASGDRPDASSPADPASTASGAVGSGAEASPVDPSEPAREGVEQRLAAATVERDEPPPSELVDSAPSTPLVPPGAFVGIGVLSGRGDSEEILTRWGGQLSAGWISLEGLRLLGQVDYSTLSVPAARVEMGWLRATAAVGYRFWRWETLSSSFDLRLGLRWVTAEARAADGARSSSRVLSPLAGVAWSASWQPLDWGGVSLTADASTIFRETRFIGEEAAPALGLAALDVGGVLGIWWKID